MRSRFRAFIDYMRFVYGSEWAYVIGLFGSVLGVVVGVVESSVPRDLVVLAGAVGIVITVVLLLRDSLDLYQRWGSADIAYGGVRTSLTYFTGVEWRSDAVAVAPEAENEKAPYNTQDGIINLRGAKIGGRSERIWRDDAVDRALWESAQQSRIELRNARYVLPERLRELAPRTLRATNSRSSGESRNKRPTWFNGALCRLMTEPTADGLAAKPLGVQLVTYYDGQASNELWPWSLTHSGREETRPLAIIRNYFVDFGENSRRKRAERRAAGASGVLNSGPGAVPTTAPAPAPASAPLPAAVPVPALRVGEAAPGVWKSVAHEYAVDADKQILSLSDARMANIVGITIIAITADNHVLFVRQSAKNSVLPKGIAASASGSLDWADAKRVQKRAVEQATAAKAAATVAGTGGGGEAGGAAATLQDLLFEGMLRELREESQVRPDEIVAGSERVSGYFRWLSRGAKPEFTGLVRLQVTLEELNTRSAKGDEKTYTDGRLAVPLAVLKSAANSWSQPQGALHAALRADLAQRTGELVDEADAIPVGASTVATWCAAADYIAGNPGYLTS